VLEGLQARGAFFRSLRDPVDTASPQGLFTLQVLGAAAQLERALIRERTKSGMRAAGGPATPAWRGRRGLTTNATPVDTAASVPSTAADHERARRATRSRRAILLPCLSPMRAAHLLPCGH
jgi:DNA invertase Pin-like site-specific DNA recombinase